MNNERLGALIPIRLASERLPNKAMLEICGRPIVWHLLDRVCASRYLDKEDVVVCTTHESSDDALVESVERYGCKVFRGSTDDIIKRFHDAIAFYGFEAVIQVDGDDPLCDTQYMDLTMEKLLSDSSLDIVTCEGLPLGIASKSFTRNAMERVYGYYKTEKNDTGFIYFFTKTGLCKQAMVMPMNSEHVLDDARLTLDYQVDFELFRNIFEALYQRGKTFGLSEVVKYLLENADVMRINSGLDEEYWGRMQEKAQLTYEDTDGTVRQV